MPLQDKKSQEKKALIVGFTLILLVVLFAFIKPYFGKNQTNNSKTASQKEIQDYPQISFSDLQNKIRSQENLQVIDIRANDFYGAEHIIDSINIPIEELETSKINAGTDKLIVVLSEGSEADKTNEYQAIQLIKDKGFKDVTALSGGMLSWKNNNGQTISWGDPNSFVDHSKVTFVSVEDLKKYISDRNTIFVLDVRPPSSFTSGRIANAINIPLENLEERRSEISSTKNIVVYGDTDIQSFQAGVKLYDLNFFSVQVLQGGFSSWEDKKMEITK
jgi:rhodanese-related sulfurtransferase